MWPSAWCCVRQNQCVPKDKFALCYPGVDVDAANTGKEKIAGVLTEVVYVPAKHPAPPHHFDIEVLLLMLCHCDETALQLAWSPLRIFTHVELVTSGLISSSPSHLLLGIKFQDCFSDQLGVSHPITTPC